MAVFIFTQGRVVKSMATSHYRLGLTLISVAVLSWGTLPIALKLTTGFIDSISLTWLRFAMAFVVSVALQAYLGQLKQFKGLAGNAWLKLSFAAVFSILNYITFTHSLLYLHPGQAQLNFQTAPFFLAFGGVLFLKEKLNSAQMTCFATLALGMLLFFHPYLDLTMANSQQKLWLGILIIQFSALSWTSYALIQKSLVSQISPNNILLFIYFFGLLVMLPLTNLNQIIQMNTEQWAIAIYCSVNTVISYGCFAQSMKYLPTSQVGPMIALTPVLSFIATSAVAALGWWPDIIQADQLDLLSMLGIALVVLSVCGIQWLPAYFAKRKLAKEKAALSL